MRWLIVLVLLGVTSVRPAASQSLSAGSQSSAHVLLRIDQVEQRSAALDSIASELMRRVGKVDTDIAALQRAHDRLQAKVDSLLCPCGVCGTAKVQNDIIIISGLSGGCQDRDSPTCERNSDGSFDFRIPVTRVQICTVAGWTGELRR